MIGAILFALGFAVTDRVVDGKLEPELFTAVTEQA